MAESIVYPNAPPTQISPTMMVQPPLSRRGHGPGLILLVDEDLDLSKHDKTLDPPPLQKWAEEGFAVVQISLTALADSLPDELRAAVSELSRLPSCDQSDRIGVVIYSAAIGPAVLGAVGSCPEIVAITTYGMLASPGTSTKPTLAHVAGKKVDNPNPHPTTATGNSNATTKTHFYPPAKPFFPIPAHANYHASSASVSHTRTLSFLKPLLGGPHFDLEAIWEEHTYWEFANRSVEQTMATMVAEPYVNHIPTMTGGVGRESLTRFYAEHFVFANPDDTELELVSRTVGVDRVVDEFLFRFTHDRVVDWLAPGVPPTGKYISVPFTSVVNIRGDRLYHEHISWDQATLLRQLGLLPDYLPFPYPVQGQDSGKKFEYRLPVVGVECARKLADESSEGSNQMFTYTVRPADGN